MIDLDQPRSTTKKIAADLINICGPGFVSTNEDELHGYGSDQTQDLHFPFDILVKPGTAEEISAIIKICNQYKVPVTPRGGGSGVTGGALPLHRGIVLSLERLDKIITINTTDHYVVAESGVIAADLCAAVEEEGLCFPVAPGSSAFSFIGGNVAGNAGSIRSCKYGTTDQYVMNLEVVLPTGEIIWSGANVEKNATGLHLTRLFAGSEGTLGIITKVVYRLIHKTGQEATFLAVFERPEDAINAVVAIKRSGLRPSAVEFIGATALKITAAYLEETAACLEGPASYAEGSASCAEEPAPLVGENINAHLLINLEYDTEPALHELMETLSSILSPFTNKEVLTGITSAEKDKLWKLRFNIGSAMTTRGRTYRDMDICMPLSELNAYLEKVEEICAAHQVNVACFGHAMDGNLHTMLLIDRQESLPLIDRQAQLKLIDRQAHMPPIDRQTQASQGKMENLDQVVPAIYAYAIANGGVISGEHGIGLLQKEFMESQFSDRLLEIMRQIKQVFDPNGILNPGKIY